jgi:hypothetical protein
VLKPHSGRVRERIEKDQTGRVWTHLEALWKAVITWSEPEVAKWNAGRPCVRWTRQAAEEFMRLGREAEVREIIVTVFAVFLMAHEWEPHFFRSDKAMRFGLVRRVRGLAPSSSGTWKGKRAMRELTPRTVECMAGVLIQAFAPAAGQLVALERQDAARKRRELEDLREAIKELG